MVGLGEEWEGLISMGIELNDVVSAAGTKRNMLRKQGDVMIQSPNLWGLHDFGRRVIMTFHWDQMVSNRLTKGGGT